MSEPPVARPGLALRWPGGMVLVFARMLCRQVRVAQAAHERDDEREAVALSVILAVTMVETFVNAHCQQIGQRTGDAAHAEALGRKFLPLEKKLRRWPKLFLGEALDERGEPWLRFDALRLKRNALMHFRGEAVSLRLGPQAVPMQDTSEFDHLVARDAFDALRAAVGLVEAWLIIGHQGDRAGVQRELALLVGTEALSLRAEPRTTRGAEPRAH